MTTRKQLQGMIDGQLGVIIAQAYALLEGRVTNRQAALALFRDNVDTLVAWENLLRETGEETR